MDEKIQKILYNLARKSFLKNNVPIAAIVLDKNNNIIGKGMNNKQTYNDVFGHAEIVAIRKAAKKIKDWRLSDCKIIITFEPCMMCTGAIIQSQIKDITFINDEPKFGFINSNHTVDLSKFNIKKLDSKNDKYDHKILIKKFFDYLRTKNKNED